MSLILSIFAYVLTSLFRLHMVELLFVSRLLEQTLAYELCLGAVFPGTRILIWQRTAISTLTSPHGKNVRLHLPQTRRNSYIRSVHPELHFVTHIPQTVHGEQLVAQLFRCIPEKSWLFKYGRIPMSFILADWVWRVGFFFWPVLSPRSCFFSRGPPHRPRPWSDVN